MAKAKFNKLDTNKQDDNITHANLQNQEKKKIGRPSGTKRVKEQANSPLTVAFTPSQKKELMEYAALDDRTAGYVIKKALIEKGIISK